jgi:hypothetical protein
MSSHEGTLSIRYTRWRQWSNAASDTDDAHHRVGQVAVVVRRVGQVLDLAHDVVAEVAHDAALQRRQVGDDAARGTRRDRVERGEHALVERDVRAEVLALRVMSPSRSTSVATGSWPTKL